MPDTPTFDLHNLSVVVTAEFHNPSILNPDFLRQQRIISAKWETVENITTPALATVTYKNGVKIIVEPNKMTVSEPATMFGKKAYVHDIVGKYVARLPHVSYSAVGLNCQASMAQQNVSKWLISRFLKPGKWLSGPPSIQAASIKLRTDADGSACNITLSPGAASVGSDKPHDAVIVECNFHHDGPFTVKKIKEICGTRTDKEEFLQGMMRRLLD